MGAVGRLLVENGRELGRAWAWLKQNWRRLPVALTVDQWRAIDADTPPGQEGRRGFDWRVLIVLVTVCLVLTAQEYVGGRDWFSARWHPSPGDEYWELKQFVWWTGWRVGGYLVLPAIIVLCMPGERLRDYYVSPRGFVQHLWLYVLMFAVVWPMVLWASHRASFQETYPFYKYANRSSFDFWSWEVMYAAQFISLEFFFRGFMLQGLRRSLGSNAIFVMIVPYCMIHYTKPLPETLGAVLAGLILGTVAMRTRSIWGGMFIHVGVALSMDFLAIGHCPPPQSGRICGG